MLAFKLLGERRSASALARAMLRACPQPAPPAITFVPATRRSVRERGFNQSETLARAVARLTGARLVKALAKSRDNEDLASLGRESRRSALAGAFRAKASLSEPVLLIDDIFTTGATADACASALKEAGAPSVGVLTFARTLHRVPTPVLASLSWESDDSHSSRH
ncbi:MAG: hypothetical protein NVSMB57_08550 [Actinomycetota bacterium]